jgi:hypothetical protein
MPAQKLTNEIISAAIAGFVAQKTKIDLQIDELRAMLQGGPSETAAAAPKGRRRKLSAAARKRISEAQRKRWAASRSGSASPSSTAAAATAKPKRKLSAAGRKAIVDALKRRWAAKRAATKKTTVKRAAVKAPVSLAAKKTAE